MITPISVQAPPSKSVSHRMFMAAALADGESRLTHVLESDDLARTRGILEAVGAAITRTGPGEYRVMGVAGNVLSPGASLAEPLSCFVGESGTTCRLITAILAAGHGFFSLHGAGRMHERPMQELTAALSLLGASFHYEDKDGNLPFTLEAKGFATASLAEGMLDMGADESSQYLSGLLLAAPLSPTGLVVRLAGKKAVSWPYIGLTLAALEAFGISFSVEVLPDGNFEGESPSPVWQTTNWRSLEEVTPGRVRFNVASGIYRPGIHAVEGDWSGASYFLAAGAIGPLPVRVEGLHADSLQGDAAMLSILAAMGAKIERSAEGITVSPSQLHGITVDMGQCPDLVPTVAAVAAHAQGSTHIYNVAHLRIKESDRLAAPAAELAKVGCQVSVTDDGLVITPPGGGIRPPAAGTLFHAHDDHRIAMGMSLLGLPGLGGGAGFPVALDNPACVAKSFPHFWELWKKVRP